MTPDSHSHFHMMSSPNTIALITLLNNAVRDPKTTAAGFKIVYVGKDKYPMSILKIVPVDNNEWIKVLLSKVYLPQFVDKSRLKILQILFLWYLRKF